MQKKYLIVILTDDSCATLREIANSFVKNNVELEKLEIDSSIDNTAWMQIVCSVEETWMSHSEIVLKTQTE